MINTKQRVAKSAFLRPYYALPIIFIFLAIRNWPVFLLTDMYDGMSFKMEIVRGGLTQESFKAYAEEFVLKAFNQHFIPLWFLFFYALSTITDNNPLALGLLSFGAAAALLYLMFQLLATGLAFNGRKTTAAAGLVTLLFSSTVFFLEMIAWKWMLSLLLSSTFFYLCLFILLKEKRSVGWKWVYGIAMIMSIWTFGLGWVWAWGLVLFLLFQRAKKSWLLPLTIIIALIGTLLAVLLNKDTVGSVNAWAFISAIPSALVIITANIFLSLIGVFRFMDVGLTNVSSVLGVSLLLVLGTHYLSRYKKGLFDTKDALICSLLIVYVATIALSLLRVIPAGNVAEGQVNIDNYIFGNRYLFAYAIPLTLAIGMAVMPYLVRLSRLSLLIMLCGAVVLGFVMQGIYPKTEPIITNKNRDAFYKLTPGALDRVHHQQLVLPDLTSDLLFKGGVINLSDAIYIRKSSLSRLPSFKAPNELSLEECAKLKSDQFVTTWLNIYSSSKWCANI